jgi:membrane protease YdiL (CAAX protease family)
VAQPVSEGVEFRPLGRNDGVGIVALSVAGFIVGQVVAIALAGVAYSLSGTPVSFQHLVALTEPPWWLIVSELCGVWIGFLGAAAVCEKIHHLLRAPGRFSLRWSDLWFLVLGGLLQLLVVVSYIPFHPSNLSAPSEKILGSPTGAAFVLVAIMTVVGAPMVEETLFRGVLLPGLRALVGSGRTALVGAVVADGLLFALAHGEWVQFPGLAAVGIVLAVIYLRTRRLGPCIITHGAFNLVAVISLAAQGVMR